MRNPTLTLAQILYIRSPEDTGVSSLDVGHTALYTFGSNFGSETTIAEYVLCDGKTEGQSPGTLPDG